jgi:hypothetical protein
MLWDDNPVKLCQLSRCEKLSQALLTKLKVLSSPQSIEKIILFVTVCESLTLLLSNYSKATVHTHDSDFLAMKIGRFLNNVFFI